MSVLLIWCVSVSILSQISALEPVARPVMYASWFVTCIYSFFAYKGKLRISRFTGYFGFIYMLYIIYCLACNGIGGTTHLTGNYIRLLFIPLVLCFLADNCAPHLTVKYFQRLLKIYLFFSVILALYVHVTYFPSLSVWRSSMMYEFGSKNSAAQIWGTAILVNMFLISYKTKLTACIKYIITGYLLLLILFSHCRTSLLGLGIVFLWNMLKGSKYKLLWLIGIMITIYGCLNIPVLQDILSHGILLPKYEGADMDTFSSGRLGLFRSAWDCFVSSPWVGVGNYYVDNSYLCVLAESGIMGFILIESIWLYKIICSFTGRRGPYLQFFSSIFIFYFVESMLEGNPPFGPGVSTMAFWLFTGILVKRKNLIHK